MHNTLSRNALNRLGTLYARDDIEREVKQWLGPHRMDVRGHDPIRAELYTMALHQGTLLEISYGQETHIDFGENADQFLFRLTLTGGCELQIGRNVVRAGPGELTVSSPAPAGRLVTSPDCRNLVLRLDRLALERKLQDMLQATLRRPLQFELAAGTRNSSAAIVLPTFDYLRQISTLPGVHAGSALRNDLTEWLMALLLTHVPHTYSDALALGTLPPLPTHVRRARDYIDAHLGESIALATLAKAVGVSPRTLQNGFQAFMLTTPAAYVRDRRLEAVHAALQRGEASNVTDVLVAHGIRSFGHFAKAYVQRYGYSPSATPKHSR
ncbi:AraC family transcriptional regulator [Burkholderia sp. Ac-20353]|uniref:AraC family transcriptional regulator n=1 Tax=Burkholderia sp. Ac-20353 TaxID=2703894 RepID=UPI00197CAEF5|nr:AraC family transcriptional regulator [Burkholderia sp. Ac-20353]MBN3787669.1 AraC family transcriptional regulator [Burkholderia sp. Ac-20353]